MTPVVVFLAFLRLGLPAVSVDLGGWSASIYVLHPFVILFIRHFSGNGSLAVSLTAGIGLLILVSMCFDWIRGWLLPRLREWLMSRARLQ